MPFVRIGVNGAVDSLAARVHIHGGGHVGVSGYRTWAGRGGGVRYDPAEEGQVEGRRIRAFLAMDMGDEALWRRVLAIGEELVRQGIPFAGVQQLHVTLHFLGAIGAGAVAAFGELLEDLDAECFEVGLEGLGVFPSEEHPAVLWMGIRQGEDVLRKLHACLQEPLARMGVPLDSRPYRPHLTLARIRHLGEGEKRRLASILEAHRQHHFGKVAVDAVSLKRSILSSAGARYTDLHVRHLRGRLP